MDEIGTNDIFPKMEALQKNTIESAKINRNEASQIDGDDIKWVVCEASPHKRRLKSDTISVPRG